MYGASIQTKNNNNNNYFECKFTFTQSEKIEIYAVLPLQRWPTVERPIPIAIGPTNMTQISDELINL